MSPDMPWWAKIGLGTFTQAMLAVALFLAYWKGDSTNLAIIIGAVVANATQALGYFFGSSSGSEKKDATIAQVATNR